MTVALQILLGIVGTVLAFYITSSILLARKQLGAAARLSSYLRHWQKWILEHELFGVYHLGVEWNKEFNDISKKRRWS